MQNTLNENIIRTGRRLQHLDHRNGNGPRNAGRILTALDTKQGLDRWELANETGLSLEKLDCVLEYLESREYIVFSYGEAETSTHIALTAAGRAAIDRIKREKQETEQLFSCLSEAEREQLATLMEKLTAQMETEREAFDDWEPYDELHHQFVRANRMFGQACHRARGTFREGRHGYRGYRY